MATTGPARYPGSTTFPGSDQYPGGGTESHIWVLYSTGDAETAVPTWTSLPPFTLRAFSSSRGRDTELSTVEAGTAQVAVDDTDRTFDPGPNPAIGPMNQWWIRHQFAGDTQDIWKGYAESYEEQWVKGTDDAVTVMSGADEMRPLNLERLPTMNPPRDTYEEVVQFDSPQGYWRGQPVPSVISGIIWTPTAGSTNMGHIAGAGTTVYVTSPILGDAAVNQPATAPGVGLARRTDTAWTTMDGDTINDYDGLVVGGPGDAGALSAMTFETWFRSDEAAPGAARNIAKGPLSGGATTWALQHDTAGTVSAIARNSGGTTYTATSASTLTADTWYHLAIVVTGSNTLIYVNGTQAGSASFTGSFGAMDASQYMQIGTSTAVGGNRSYDEIAFYRTNLAAARLLAHYQAGLRGYPAQDPGARIASVLDTIGSHAPRSLRAGSRELIPVFQRGQSPLDELRRAEEGEAVDAVLFISKSGTVTFLDDGHRSSSPWNTVQATFDDDGTDLPYNDITIDYSDRYLKNEWNVTREGGTTQTASDATSISKRKKRPESIASLPITTDSDASAIATAMLAKYKDPMRRITRLEILAHTPDQIDTVFRREIGDRIRVLRTPPGGGSRIDQEVFIQKIDISGRPGEPIRVVWGLSPL